MCAGMLQGIFMLSPVDNDCRNISQLVQVSLQISSLSATYYRLYERQTWSPHAIGERVPFTLESCPAASFHCKYLQTRIWIASASQQQEVIGQFLIPLGPSGEKDPFHSAYLAACCLAIMGALNELWSNSQLNALKGMPQSPAWKASGVKCLFFKSAANVGCFQVCYCPAGFPFQPTPAALLMWRRVEARGDGQEKTT